MSSMVTSDMHSLATNGRSDSIETFVDNSLKKYAISRYRLVDLSNKTNCESAIECISEDECFKRPKRRRICSNVKFITLYHEIETVLDMVGMQLWRGALILADYLLHQEEIITNKVIVELGCGVGFLGIILSLLNPEKVLLTDYSQDILNLATKNVQVNSHLSHNSADNIEIALLDWKDYNGRHFQQKYEDLLISTSVIYLAADVVYDDELTENFFLVLLNLMKNEDHLWLSIELRFNFSITELSLVAHGYRRFLNSIHVMDDNECLPQSGKLKFAKDDKVYIFKAQRIFLDFPQRVMEYNRVKDIELWDITKVLLD